MRRRSRSPRTVVQSYKKVLNYAPASRLASTNQVYGLSTGVDSVAAGQTSAIDDNVPTGSIIKQIEIQYSTQNLVNVAAFLWISIQRIHSGQGQVNPQTVGGNPQRNQVHFQRLRSMGQNQNVDNTIIFKVPKKFQRVREGDAWQLVTQCSEVFTDACQVIYKFYR